MESIHKITITGPGWGGGSGEPNHLEGLISAEWEKYDNILFPSKEDDGIEHVDESYEGFKEMLIASFTHAYQTGIKVAMEAVKSEETISWMPCFDCKEEHIARMNQLLTEKV